MRRKVTEFEVHRRHLPHWQAPGASYFLTFSLRRPAVVDLTDPRLAPIVIHALRYRDGDWHWLYDYTVMPDHAHAILKPIVQDDGATSLSDILQGVKSWSAHEMNRVLRRKGPLWQDETHNRILRDEAEYREKANYILQNAHDWGLVDDPTEWPWWGKGNGPW